MVGSFLPPFMDYLIKSFSFHRKTSTQFVQWNQSSKDEVCYQAHTPKIFWVEHSSLSSNPGAHLCDTCASSLCSPCRLTLTRPLDSIRESAPYRTGSSSHSIESSDSAFCDQRLLDLNDGLHHPSTLQETLLYVYKNYLIDFECYWFRALKSELASLINKENIYQTIIKERTDVIRKLEKQLSDVLQSQTSSSK